MPSGFDASPLVTPAVADSPGRVLRQLVPTPLPGTMRRNQASPLQLFQDTLRCYLFPLQDSGCVKRRHPTLA